MIKRKSLLIRVDNIFVEGIDNWVEKYGYPRVEITKMIGKAIKEEKIILGLPEVKANGLKNGSIKKISKKESFLGDYDNWDVLTK